MKWLRHNNLSDSDFEALRGTPTMERLQKHRLVIILDPNDKMPNKKDMGLFETTGLVYWRNLSGRDDTIEIMFEDPEDLDNIEQHLTQYKLGQE
jgi:hypothetical protein